MPQKGNNETWMGKKSIIIGEDEEYLPLASQKEPPSALLLTIAGVHDGEVMLLALAVGPYRNAEVETAATTDS